MRLAIRKAIELYALDRERGALLSELTLINQLSRALHRELDLRRLLALLLDAAHHELGFDAASLLFFTGNDGAMEWAGLEPGNNEVAERVRAIEITEQDAPEFIEALRNGQAQALRLDHSDDLEPPIQRWVLEVCAEEILVVPLMGNRGVVGAFAIDNRSGGRRFGADDRTLLDGLAMQAVVAIENARMVEELKRSREQVIRADRLGTLGTLAAGLAHEINNPLVSINTFLTLAPQKRNEEDDGFWTEYHELACSELDRIRGLVSTMSRLGHGNDEPPTPAWTDVPALAREVVSLVQRDVRKAGVTLELEIADDAPLVMAVRDHIHQVILNLILNAVQAAARDGMVKVAVGADEARPGEGLWISVEDDGDGISPEHLERIFDPFFTTKDPDQGTGLGLMISHKIVTDHGGTVEVSSERDQGACFRVRLPVKGPCPQAEPGAA
jgi:signal transduction histidine kinase